MDGDDLPTHSLVGLSEAVPAAPGPGAQPFAIDADRRYHEVEVVGAGGLGTVLLARDQRLDREVALKRIGPGADPTLAAAAFQREARITARLDHPGIVPIHDAGRTADGRLFYTMRLIRGRSLAEVAAATVDADARLALVGAVTAACHAVGYAHRHGVVHRDLKPANVMLGEYGETQVVDWGLAHDHARDGAVTGAAGTPAYLSPESVRGAAGTPAADVWALGAILYEVVTGARLVPGDRDAAMAALRAGRPPALVWPDEVPGELRAIVARAVATDPAARYPDAEALAGDLEAFRDGRRVAAYRYSTWELARRLVVAWRWPLAALATAVIAAIVALTATNHRIARQRTRAVAAEQATRVELGRAEAALARALATSAVTAFTAGRHAEAEQLAAAALAHGDDVDARGVLATLHAEPTATPVTRVELPGCPWVIPGVDGEALCLGRGYLELWTLAPPARRWRVDRAFDGAVATSTVVVAWDAAALTTIDRPTGAVQVFADPSRRAPVELDRPERVAVDADRARVAIQAGLQIEVMFDTEAFAILDAPCGAASIDALALGRDLVWMACGDGAVRAATVDGVTHEVDVGAADGRGRATALAVDEAGLELAIGTATGAVTRVDLRSCLDRDCARPAVEVVPARGLGSVRALALPGAATLVVSDSGDAVLVGVDAARTVRRIPVTPGAAVAVAEAGVVVGGAALWTFAWTDQGGPAGWPAPLRPTALALTDAAVAIGGDAEIVVTISGAVTRLPVRGQVASLAWSPDGTRLAAALLDDPDAGVRWYAVAPDRTLGERPLPGAPGAARHVAFDADGTLRATSGSGMTTWDPGGRLARHDGPAAGPISADGGWACSADGQRWRRAGLAWTQRGACGGVLGLAADAAGRYLALARRREVALEDLASGATVTLPLGPAEVTALALSAAGDWLAVGTGTGVVELRRTSDGAVVARLASHAHRITGLWFAGAAVITAGVDGTVRRHDLAPLTASPAQLAAAAAARWRPLSP
ncbi:MAG: serine/threonine-protein kinase [Kofleriaceae bacterium]